MKEITSKMVNLSKHSILLSHHKPYEYYRCFKIKNEYICARCLGIHSVLYPTLFYQFFVHPFSHSFIIIALYIFPLFSCIDWGLHRFNIYKGTNISRVLSGFFLGISFATMFYIFLKDTFNLNLWISVLIYFIIGWGIYKLSEK